MTKHTNGRSPEQRAAWNRLHAIVAVLLALLLAILWFTGYGPGSANVNGTCCGAPAAIAAAPASPVDSDGDGVFDAQDACPDTSAGIRVDARGCDVAAAAAPVAATPAPVPAANLYFDVDKTVLPADTATLLADLVAYLKANSGAVAAISGYHDPTGDREHNLELAKNRAKAVQAYLLAQGIEESRTDLVKPIETTGTGSLDEARRVEVSVRP